MPEPRFLFHERASLGFEAYGEEQQFYTNEGKLAFTVRYYKNHNAHMKVDKDLMMKFNIEVARLRNWINSHTDTLDEFDVTEEEAIRSMNWYAILVNLHY